MARSFLQSRLAASRRGKRGERRWWQADGDGLYRITGTYGEAYAFTPFELDVIARGEMAADGTRSRALIDPGDTWVSLAAHDIHPPDHVFPSAEASLPWVEGSNSPRQWKAREEQLKRLADLTDDSKVSKLCGIVERGWVDG